MKLLAVILSLIFVALATGLTDEEKKDVENNRACVKDVGVDESFIKQLRQGDFSIGDEDHQRFVFCIFRKNNVITVDGKFDKDIALTKIPKDKRKKGEVAISACMHEKGATPQETAWKLAKCYYGKNPEHEYV